MTQPASKRLVTEANVNTLASAAATDAVAGQLAAKQNVSTLGADVAANSTVRAAYLSRTRASDIPLTPRPVKARVRFPLGTAGRMVLGTERGRVGAVLVNTSASQVLKIGVGALDSTSAPGSYVDVAVGQEMPVGSVLPVWAYYPTTADTVLVLTEVAA